MLLLGLVLLSQPLLGARINITLYHVNPANYSGVADMDLGDEAGDTFFTARNLGLPMFCRDEGETQQGRALCSNPEVISADLIVSRITLEASTDFGPYGYCDVCTNGTYPGTQFLPRPLNCTNGEYVCLCKLPGGFQPCEEDRVGYRDVAATHPFPPSGSHPYFFWQANLAAKIGGFWYTPFRKGENKSWRLVETEGIANATCQKELFLDAVREKDPSCYNACPRPDDVNSNCYINCVYRVLLGDKASTSKAPTDEGIAGNEITQLWYESYSKCLLN
mmetsp:Transcript_13516/g.18704  ORF Transcript_13516/g.18704 Transcript_13516/m.18704 type:complete len:277 (-) Transcript_13516:157-987(-)